LSRPVDDGAPARGDDDSVTGADTLEQFIHAADGGPHGGPLRARCAPRSQYQSLDNQIALAYDLAFNRRPNRWSLSRKQFAARHGLAAFCRVIFNSNEFLYVD